MYNGYLLIIVNSIYMKDMIIECTHMHIKSNQHIIYLNQLTYN